MSRRDRIPRAVHITQMRNGQIRVECHRPDCPWFRDTADPEFAVTLARVHARDCSPTKKDPRFK